MSQTPSNVERLKALLADAIELSAAERAKLIASVRRENETLAADLTRMLASHDAASEGGGFMVDPTLDPADTKSDGRIIGPFRLLKLIGEGGFGEVYLAEQSSPIRRNVALKLIKPGMDSGQILARFNAERQALAIMDHPNIARVFDAGTDDRGRPWFAMEFVDGEPIHTFADKQRLDVRQRIDLMIPVCRAVHHAHQKGVIHRDLKPGNVLVSLVDGRAVPKVIDFGVAKALDHSLAEKTIFTELRTLVGTPEYMSPEQAEFDGGRDIDTRSDVYSLGVLLYELLVGATPFDGKDLRSRAFGEIQRILREVDPPTPSTRFSSLSTRASAAALRNIDPAKLSTSLRGELDWITMKCIEKDRTRRYDSAAALAEELSRYLENQPIVAGPVSRAYRVRKFVRRHQVGVVATSMVSAAVLVGVAGVIWGSIQARRERNDAITAREQADASRKAAEASRIVEAEARSIAQENNQFLRDMFESIDPSTALGKEVSVREVLDAATSKIDAVPLNNPSVEAELRGTFGRAYSALGLLSPARKQLERARELQDTSRETTRALIDVMILQADYVQATALADKAIAQAVAAHGPDTLAELSMLNARADILVHLDKRAEAETLLNSILARAQEIDKTKPDRARTVIVEALSSLSSLQMEEGRFAEAEKGLIDALQQTRDPAHADGPQVIGLQSNLGDLYRSIGRFNDAVTTLAAARENAIKVLGPDNSTTLTVSNNLALAMMTVGRIDEAEKLYDQIIASRVRLLGEDHPRTLLARSNRGLVYQQQARFDVAETEFADLATRYNRVLGPDHQDTIIAENNYASLMVKLHRFEEAEPIFRRLIDRVEKTQGRDNLAYTSLSLRLASVLAFKGDNVAAEPIYAQAFAGAERMGIADAQAGFAMGYGICLAELGKAEKAIEILSRADAALSKIPNPDPVGVSKVAGAMVKALTQLGHTEEAEKWKRSATTATSQPTTLPAK